MSLSFIFETHLCNLCLHLQTFCPSVDPFLACHISLGLPLLWQNVWEIFIWAPFFRNQHGYLIIVWWPVLRQGVRVAYPMVTNKKEKGKGLGSISLQEPLAHHALLSSYPIVFATYHSIITLRPSFQHGVFGESWLKRQNKTGPSVIIHPDKDNLLQDLLINYVYKVHSSNKV